MGWTSFRLNEPIKDWFKHELESSNKYIVLDSALVERTTMFAAIQEIETKEVFCVVYIINWSKGYFNFSYKDMTEFAGPCAYNCPERIFRLLTQLNDENDPNGWARGWREKVGLLINKRKAICRIKANNVIKTSEPIGFSNNYNYQYFKKVGKKYYAGFYDNNRFINICRVKLNLINLEYKLI